jgi:pyruvate/2-oxoglutarate dehydrogenase complex dihydrolipoamide acyltransferase (E2) component
MDAVYESRVELRKTMKHEIRVPAVSEGVTEGTVVNITVAVGDSVEVDQTLLELETDKAVVEVPSSHAGKITEVQVAEGDRVAIDAVIMVLESSGGGEEVEAPEIDSEEIPAPVVEEEPVSTVVTEQVEPAEPQTSSPPPRDEPQVDLNTVRRNDLVPADVSVKMMCAISFAKPCSA